jgi:hypothetical protein
MAFWDVKLSSLVDKYQCFTGTCYPEDHGSTMSYAANMVILMILYDFCLLPAQFYNIIVYAWKVESRVQIADQCALWKISNGAENHFL